MRTCHILELEVMFHSKSRDIFILFSPRVAQQDSGNAETTVRKKTQIFRKLVFFAHSVWPSHTRGPRSLCPRRTAPRHVNILPRLVPRQPKSTQMEIDFSAQACVSEILLVHACVTTTVLRTPTSSSRSVSLLVQSSTTKPMYVSKVDTMNAFSSAPHTIALSTHRTTKGKLCSVLSRCITISTRSCKYIVLYFLYNKRFLMQLHHR